MVTARWFVSTALLRYPFPHNLWARSNPGEDEGFNLSVHISKTTVKITAQALKFVKMFTNCMLWKEGDFMFFKNEENGLSGELWPSNHFMRYAIDLTVVQSLINGVLWRWRRQFKLNFHRLLMIPLRKTTLRYKIMSSAGGWMVLKGLINKTWWHRYYTSIIRHRCRIGLVYYCRRLPMYYLKQLFNMKLVTMTTTVINYFH